MPYQIACTAHCGFSILYLQAQKLDDLLAHRGIAIDRVLDFEVPDSVLVWAVTILLLHIGFLLCILWHA